jgi:hypothetical protein
MKFACAMMFGAGLAGLFLLAGSSVSAQDSAKTLTPAPPWVQEKWVQEKWVQEKWPFPIDQWGTGLAFGCAADRCGSEMHLYVRAKIGFCRCATGVSDDDEIDRVGDLELIGADYRPLAPGHAVTAGIMAGRARLFAVERALQPAVPVLTIALANKCDAIVATVLGKPDVAPDQEGRALDFLRSATVQHWVEDQTGTE